MIKLGTRVKDSITGFEGVATARCEYLYGCVRIEVSPEGLEEGKPIGTQWFDEQRLSRESKAKVGGPGNVPPSRSLPN